MPEGTNCSPLSSLLFCSQVVDGSHRGACCVVLQGEGGGGEGEGGDKVVVVAQVHYKRERETRLSNRRRRRRRRWRRTPNKGEGGSCWVTLASISHPPTHSQLLKHHIAPEAGAKAAAAHSRNSSHAKEKERRGGRAR